MACWSEIPPARENCCVRCGEDLFEATATSAAAANLCRPCRMAPPAFIRAVSYGVYEGSMRAAIHALKYSRMAPLTRELGSRLASAIALLAPLSSEDAHREMFVIPVPLHRSRMTERGFNQSRTLAVEAMRILRRTHPEWRLELSLRSLVRQRSTESQAGLTPRQRRLNLRGAFFVSDGEAVRGRHILLVDDIYTTGATTRACSKVLVEAGAASVRVATLARAQRRVPLQIRDGRNYKRLSIPEADVADPDKFSPDKSKAVTVH